jgi:hypothetical protein
MEAQQMEAQNTEAQHTAAQHTAAQHTAAQHTAAQQLEAEMEKEYLAQLTERELKILALAKQHLKSSFCLQKSIGYQKWLKERDELLAIEKIMAEMPLSQME